MADFFSPLGLFIFFLFLFLSLVIYETIFWFMTELHHNQTPKSFRLFDEHLVQGLKEGRTYFSMFREIKKTAESTYWERGRQKEGGEGCGGERGNHADHNLLPICRTNRDHQSGRSPGRHRGGEHRAALSGVSWPHARAEVHLVLQRTAHPFWKPLGLLWESRRGEWSHDITGPSKTDKLVDSWMQSGDGCSHVVWLVILPVAEARALSLSDHESLLNFDLKIIIISWKIQHALLCPGCIFVD